MSRCDRLCAGPGFAIFTRTPSFVAELLADYLAGDGAVKHVVCVPHVSTPPALLGAVEKAVHEAGRVFDPVSFEEYGAPETIHRIGALRSESLAIVVLDLRRMVSNRLDLRLHYLYTRHRARKKIVVDLVPYEAMPWRVYFPFGVFDRHLLAFNHSYAIEQDYDKFLDGYTDVNPCDAELVASKTWTAAFVDAPQFFVERPVVEVIPAIAADHAAYAVKRDALFASAKGITTVKAQLTKWIQERYPRREIPIDLKKAYAPDLRRIVATDLPFDAWLVREIEGLMNHTDTLYRLYMQHQTAAGE